MSNSNDHPKTHEQAGQGQPKTCAEFIELGDALNAKDSHTEALSAYAEAMKLDPDNLEASGRFIVLQKRMEAERIITQYNANIEREPGNAELYIEFATKLQEIGRNDEALPVIRKALEIDEESAIAHAALGTSHFKAKEFDKALPEMRRAHELAPQNAEIRSKLGVILAMNEQLHEGIEMQKGALEIEPDNARYLCELAKTVYNSGKTRKGMEMMLKAAEIGNMNYFVQVQVAQMLTHQKRYPEAVTILKWATTLEPENPTAHNRLGAALMMLGQTAEAIDAFKMSAYISPDSHSSQLALGMLLAQSENYDEAMSFLDRANEIQPTTTGLSTLGDCYQLNGNQAEAMKYYEAAIDQMGKSKLEKESDIEISNNMLKPIKESGNKKLYLKLARKIVKLAPEQGAVFFFLGDALESNGLIKKAIRAYEKSISMGGVSRSNLEITQARISDLKRMRKANKGKQKGKGKMPNPHKKRPNNGTFAQRIDRAQRRIEADPKSVELRIEMGDILFHAGMIEESAELYQDAMELEPENAKALFHVGQASVALGDFDKALVTLGKAATIDQSPHILLNLALVMMKQGLESAAETLLRDVMEKQPENSLVYQNLGAALATQGKHYEALSIYQKGLEIEKRGQKLPRRIKAITEAINDLKNM